MRYIITSQQFDSFHREGHLLLEGLYTPEQTEKMKNLIEKAPPSIAPGRDIEREYPPLLYALHLRRVGRVANSLFRKKWIKVAYTQVTPGFSQSGSLAQLSSFTEVIGGVLIHLQSHPRRENDSLPSHPQPPNPGSLIFFLPDYPIDFPKIDPKNLLIVFATDRSCYKFEKKDPSTHALKKLGFGFGDLLSETTHPLIHK